jgi:iron complex outermembrane receptor protein
MATGTSLRRGVARALGGLLGCATFAAVAPHAAAAEGGAAETRASGKLEEVVVSGKRVSEAAVAIGTDEISNTISVTREALLSAPAGISGLKMLESLPGFNVQANDTLGLYEFGNSVFVRAFNFQQIGFVLDGIPMGRSDQFGGSPIFRYVDNENLARVTASQGAGDVALPSYASLGPIVEYVSLDPAAEPGATFAQTLGSDDLSRNIIRVESGEYHGLSAYVSRSKIDSDLWRGPGTIDREHIEGKVNYRFGPGHELSFKYIHNKFFDFDTPAISLRQYQGTAGDIFGRSGRYFGYLGYVPDLPPTVAGVPFSNPNHSQYYLQAINQRTDALYGLTGRFVLGANGSLNVTGYYEDKSGYGVSPEAYATSLTNYNNERLIVPGLTAPKGLQYGLSTVGGERYGLTAGLSWQLGAHRLQAGFWVETDDYHRTQARYNQAGGNPAGEPLLNEPVHLQRDYESTRDTIQGYAKDMIALFDDRLKLDVGVKLLDIDYKIEGYRNPADYINSRQPKLEDSWSDSLLPQVGLVYSVNPTDQLFASYAENMALPRGADDIFSAASPIVPGPDPERSKNYELGYRTNRPTFNAALSLYYTTFDNRLEQFSAPVPGSGTIESFFQNVGGVKSYGAELSGVWKPEVLDGRLYFNTNASYNVVEFQDGRPGLDIEGNRVPDNAEWVVQGGATFEATSWLVMNVSGRYIGERFTNFTNTERVGGYTVYSAYVDIGADDVSFGPLKNLKLRLNVENFTDRDYLGNIFTTTSTPAFFRPGPPRAYLVTITAGL